MSLNQNIIFGIELTLNRFPTTQLNIKSYKITLVGRRKKEYRKKCKQTTKRKQGGLQE